MKKNLVVFVPSIEKTKKRYSHGGRTLIPTPMNPSSLPIRPPLLMFSVHSGTLLFELTGLHPTFFQASDWRCAKNVLENRFLHPSEPQSTYFLSDLQLRLN